SSRRRHTRCYRDWSSDVCSSDLAGVRRGPLLTKKTISGLTRLAGCVGIYFSKVGPLFYSRQLGKKEEPKKQSEVSKAAKGFFYGMALHGMVTYALRLRMHMENLFMLITMGD